MTIYLANGTKLALIARETAPAAAYKDMYHGNANLTHYGTEVKNRKYHCDAISFRSPGLRCAWLRGRHLGVEAAPGQPRCHLGAPDPAVGGHVLRGDHSQQPRLPHDASGLIIAKMHIVR